MTLRLNLTSTVRPSNWASYRLLQPSIEIVLVKTRRFNSSLLWQPMVRGRRTLKLLPLHISLQYT